MTNTATVVKTTVNPNVAPCDQCERLVDEIHPFLNEWVCVECHDELRSCGFNPNPLLNGD